MGYFPLKTPSGPLSLCHVTTFIIFLAFWYFCDVIYVNIQYNDIKEMRKSALAKMDPNTKGADRLARLHSMKEAQRLKFPQKRLGDHFGKYSNNKQAKYVVELF